MAVRQYIGARYVPRFTGLYDNTQSYEALDVVDNGSGTSYIAKKPTPAGTPLTDTDYWFLYGSTNGAIVNLQDQINDMKDGTVPGSLQDQINDNASGITALTNLIVAKYNTVSDMKSADLSENDIVQTIGYYQPNDGGASIYKIVSAIPSNPYEVLNNGLYAELQHDGIINVLQIGAKGDGITDDVAAFEIAISYANVIIVPMGNNKTYVLSHSISLGLRQSMITDTPQSISNYPLLSFTSGGVIITNRDVLIDGVAIKTSNTSKAIQIGETNGVNCPHVTIKNLYIYDAEYCIYTEKPSWSLLIESVRVYNAVNGMYIYNCGPCVTLTNCYFDRCSNYLLYSYASRISARGCNFGFITGSNVYLATGTNIDFLDCNFECDEAINNIMIRANSRMVSFRTCKFGINGVSGCAVMITSSSLWSCVLENCQFAYQGASAEPGGYEPPFVDINYFSMYKYGSFVYGKGCESIPRFTPTNAGRPYIVDIDNLGVPHFWSTIDLTKLTSGTILYCDSTNQLCYYNGTNVVDMDGTVIV